VDLVHDFLVNTGLFYRPKHVGLAVWWSDQS
jgi:hypothetical protein